MFSLAQTLAKTIRRTAGMGVLIATASVLLLNAGAAPPAWSVWKQKRMESVAGTNGWITLVGLHWLQEGDNPAGSDSDQLIKLAGQATPGRIGTFFRTREKVRFVAFPGVAASVDGSSVSEAWLRTDKEGKPSVVAIGELRLTVLSRGERLALRVRQSTHPNRRAFQGLEYFEYQPEFRVEGIFVPHRLPKMLPMAVVTGGTTLERSPGKIRFRWQNRDYELDALEDREEGDLFILFRDATNGGATYAGGRYLHAALPGTNGQVVLDFNFAYNPPCAFTPFATCQIPPAQNDLPFAIPAGEKRHRSTSHTIP
ncbi:MAG: DUF1684 domain-containing protein [Verrucomicrobia bacterium]|nr:DUF1684 domain-containing protein [Verrucomicrobiota bacterium]